MGKKMDKGDTILYASMLLIAIIVDLPPYLILFFARDNMFLWSVWFFIAFGSIFAWACFLEFYKYKKPTNNANGQD